MNTKKLINSSLLMLAALIWGFAFVAQKQGLNDLGPFMINSLRSYLAGVVLLPLIAVLGKKAPQPSVPGTKKDLILGGICCGTALFLASSFQQFGLIGTDAGKSGFITAMYIVIVPIFAMFLGRKTTIKTWVSVFIAVIGMYLLCVKDNFTIEISDLLVLCCAALFSVHILVIDHFSPKVEGVKLSCIQFFVTGTLSLLAALIFGENMSIDSIFAAKYSILYLGVLSSGAGYTLQIVAQNGLNPTLASMLMSLESVFALIAGALFGEQISLRGGIGCIVMFIAVILVQLPEKKKCV